MGGGGEQRQTDIEGQMDGGSGEGEGDGDGASGHLKDLLGSLLHARPHLVAEAPQRVELEDGVDALARLLVVQLRHHHLRHGVRHLDGAQQEHGGCGVGGVT